MQHLGPDVLFAVSSTPIPRQQQTGMECKWECQQIFRLLLKHVPLHLATAHIIAAMTFLVLHFDS